MNRLFNAIVVLTVCIFSSCQLKTTEEQKSPKPRPLSKQPVVKQQENKQREFVDQMTFVEYLDDGDYYQILARKGDSAFSFINDLDDSRNINRGDPIQVKWKSDSITVPGDNESKMPAAILLELKKTADGPVSTLRKTYGKKLKYTWATDHEYTSSYLDKIYLIVEYYLTQTKNPLLQLALKNKDEVTYSVELKKRDDHDYTMIGICVVRPNGANIVQWLYIDEESDKIYEYDLPADKLIVFTK